MTRSDRCIIALLVSAAAMLIAWVRLLPASLSSLDAVIAAPHRFTGADGAEHTYLGDLDSYLWLRLARNYLQSGTTCDAVVDGTCRDTFSNAPLGRVNRYARSLHIAAIVGVHRFITWFRPGYPLSSSSYWVPVLLGALGAIPAFGLGRLLAGDAAGLVAAVLIGLNPIFLGRTIGSDNDVWNVVLPLFMVWAACEALASERRRTQVLCTLLSAVAAGAHAATWRGWVLTFGVLLTGMLATLAVHALRVALHEGLAVVWRARPVRHVALVCGLFFVATGITSALAGADDYLTIPAQVLRAVTASGAEPAAAVQIDWPNTFETVAELTHPNLAGIVRFMDSPRLFFVSWLGLLVLALPARGWKWWHYALLIAGNYLYRSLLTATSMNRSTLILLLSIPIGAAIVMHALAEDDADDRSGGAALTVIVWFLTTLYLAYGGLRYAMLLVPPFALAAGAAVGRLQEWVTRQWAHRFGVRYAVPVQLASLACVALLLMPSIRAGVAGARTFRPMMDDAWWNALIAIRDTAPVEAIVNTWWDYGYWVEYVAERRATADGGSLATHIPYWMARALFAADDREAAGLLRMLNCGSDAAPEPEGRLGAFTQLVAAGIDPIQAQQLIIAIAPRTRSDADAYLAERGLAADVRRSVLAATHCPPPPASLVLSSDQIVQAGWRLHGGWDFERAYLVKHLRTQPESVAVAELGRRFARSETDARALYRAAAALATPAAERKFISPHAGYLSPAWVPCRATSESTGDLRCPVNGRVGDGVLEAFVYHTAEPRQSRLEIRRSAGASAFDVTPKMLLLARERAIETIDFPQATYPDIAVLLDLPAQRVLLGAPETIRSTFTQLMFLDGRTTRAFRKVGEHSGAAGRRVLIWQIDWTDPPSR